MGEALLVLVGMVLLVHEVGNKSFLIDMEFAKVKRMIQGHAKFMSDSIPRTYHASLWVHFDFAVRISVEMGPEGSGNVVERSRSRR